MWKTGSTIALLSVLLVPLPRARAWNNHGHMAIAKIAYDQLSDGQKLKIAKILQAHPHYKLFLLKDKPEKVSENEWAFLRAATWADWVRPDRSGNKPKEITKFHKGAWHFCDLPFVDAARVRPEDRARFRAEKLQPKGETALTALKGAMEKLTAKDTAPADRAVALCWLLHLVGDIHQPLHCVSCFSSDYPEGDRGGNDQLVKVNGRTINLHAYWDGALGTRRRYADIAESAAIIVRDPRHSRAALKTELARSAFADWIKESFDLARSEAYRDGKLKTRKLPRGQSPRRLQGEPLPADYGANAKKVARRQAALAGLRLADKVRTILKQG